MVHRQLGNGRLIQALALTAIIAVSGTASAQDADNDGILDGIDNCRFDANQAQEDQDSDGLGDSCDDCIGVANGPDGPGPPLQVDANGNGMETHVTATSMEMVSSTARTFHRCSAA